MLTSHDGLFNKTNTAAQEQKKASIIEAVKTADVYLEIDNKMPDSENKDGKKDIIALIDKLAEISEVKDDGKNYRIEKRPDEQAATIIDLKMKVVVDVRIEDNEVKFETGITDNIEEVIPPTIELSYDPKEPNTPVVTITIKSIGEKTDIAKIQFPDNTEKTYTNKNLVTETYSVSENGTYKFVVVGTNGRRTTETIEISNTKKVADISMEIQNSGPESEKTNILIKYDENPAFQGKLLTNEDRYQYSIGENNWETARTNPIPISVEENGYVYARYYTGTEGYKIATLTIDNIDKEKPNSFELEVTATADSITVSGITTDIGSTGIVPTATEHIGIQGYQFQLKNNDGSVKVDWTPEKPQNFATEGSKETYTFTMSEHELNEGVTYKVNMRAIDLAGNPQEALNKDTSIALVLLPKPIAQVVKVGNYVDYKAGNWTQADFNKIIASTGSPAVNGSTNPPTTHKQFGGFTIGKSRDSNAMPSGSDYKPTSSGWRVWSIDSTTGEVTLIHAGQPELFYMTYQGQWDARTILLNRNCSMYENSYAKEGSAHILTALEACSWHNKQYGTNYTIAENGYSSATFINSVTLASGTLLQTGAYYYFATVGSSTALYGWHPGRRITA